MAEQSPREPGQSGLSSAAPPKSGSSRFLTPETDRSSQGSGDAGSFLSADELSEMAYAESSTSIYLPSISSAVRRGVTENGRVYPNYGKNAYGMPMDEPELDRNDLQHSKFLLILEGKLHLAPISESPKKILDLGTGTGIWAMDMADAYPSALVTGVDIAPVQPTWVPPNCIFELEDVEADWTFADNSFDFIFARELMTGIRDWKRLIDQSFTRLKPGGWLEMCGTVPEIRSDDHTIPEDSAYVETSKIFFHMTEKMGCQIRAPISWRHMMESSGLVEVKENVYKIPMGPWAKNKRLKQIGAVERMQLFEGLEGFMLRGFTQVLGGDRNALQLLLAGARKEILDPKIHTYVLFYVVYGRKPELANAS